MVIDMLRSLLRLLYTTLYLSFRKNVITSKYSGPRTYERTYSEEYADILYTVKVTELTWVVDYRLFYIPKLKRKQYYAELTYIKHGVVDRVFTDTYPKLNWGIGLGPRYPLVVVAGVHIDKFFQLELKI